MHENGKQLKLGYSYIACACNLQLPRHESFEFLHAYGFQRERGGEGGGKRSLLSSNSEGWGGSGMTKNLLLGSPVKGPLHCLHNSYLSSVSGACKSSHCTPFWLRTNNTNKTIKLPSVSSLHTFRTTHMAPTCNPKAQFLSTSHLK